MPYTAAKQRSLYRLTRSKSNRDVLTRFEQLLDEYFEGSAAERDGLPSVKHFADKLCLSSNYFGDMLKKETGKTPQEYIQEKIIEVAKDRISGTQDTVSQIAYSLGFNIRSTCAACLRNGPDAHRMNTGQR